MRISESTKKAILSAEAKALATQGPSGLNVVPVSVVEVYDDTIYLFDFFMKKTRANVLTPQSPVSLVCWSGPVGVQVRAEATYCDRGDVFDSARERMLVAFPKRFLKGVLILKPSETFEVRAG